MEFRTELIKSAPAGYEEEEAEGVLRATVEVRVKYCVVVIVEVMVADEETKYRGSRVRQRRIVMINNEKIGKK